MEVWAGSTCWVSVWSTVFDGWFEAEIFKNFGATLQTARLQSVTENWRNNFQEVYFAQQKRI